MIRMEILVEGFYHFIGVIKGPDGIINHAIDIFNDWIFDGKENLLPLYY